MSAQRKKAEINTTDQHPDSSQSENRRPNIDHMLKKINVERKMERRNNLTMMIVGIITIAVISFVFTQA